MAVAFLAVLALPPLALAQEVKGPAAEKVIFKGLGSQDIAELEIRAGNIDLFFYNLKTEAARALRARGDIRLVEVPSSMVSIVLNPAPAPPGELNPFSIREVRYAMQFVVDRETIASRFYGGMAVPMYSHVSPVDLDHLTVEDAVARRGIRYDPEYARQVVGEAMRRAGAELREGVWHYGGKPVTVRVIVRPEDERREIGLAFAAELRRLGFNVEEILLEFGPAIQRVYSTDPRTFAWHAYTEGWGRGAVGRYDSAGINQFCAPWLGNMPGWREVGFWQYENPRLDELGQRIFRGEFRDFGERNELYRAATDLCLEESVRVWVVTVINSHPVAPGVRNLITDLVAGVRSVFSLREASVEGRNVIRVGHLWVDTERTTWNPVGGFGDVYSVDIWRYLVDPPLVRDPVSGRTVPFRSDFKVETAGPTGTLAVPPDALTWNADAAGWRRVMPGTTARSKVTFDMSKYIGAKWHHGQTITWADVLYSIYQAFDISYNPNKNRIETAIAVTSRPYLETIKGIRIVGDRYLEVYVDYWDFETDKIAEYAAIGFPSMPWEVLAAMDELVFGRRRAAYSDTAAFRFNVVWINLVKELHGRMLVDALRSFAERRYVPANVFTLEGRTLVSPDEALRRYEAAVSWFNARRHLVISNGPFYLERFDGAAQTAEISAFRDATYPFSRGSFLGFAKEARLPTASPEGRLEIPIGAEAVIAFRVTGDPGTKASVRVYEAGTGKVVFRSADLPVVDGRLRVSLPAAATSQLRRGLVVVDVSLYNPETLGVVRTLRFTTEALPAGAQPPQVVQTPTAPAPATQQPQQLPLTLVAVVAAVAVAAVSAALVVVVMRRRKG
ncbi:MAG: ABC transporter substrate-binding protein [Nitrososphaerota archaeon]|nr:ABC transporter substrate-binding protein [Nitrososphaerota archaeon]